MTINHQQKLDENPVTVCIIAADEDSETAKRLHENFIKLGIKPWLSQIDVLAGQSPDHEFRNRIETSDRVLPLLSKHSLTKRGVAQKQLKKAVDIFQEFPTGAIFIIPVQLDPTEPLDEKLRELKSVKLYESFDDGFRQIIRAIDPEKVELVSNIDISQKRDHLLRENNGSFNDENRSHKRNAETTSIRDDDHNQLKIYSIDKSDIQLKAELIELLLACDAIGDPETRNAIVKELPPHIRNTIRYNASPRVHVNSIVNRCMDFENGLSSFIHILKTMEGPSIEMKRVENFFK